MNLITDDPLPEIPEEAYPAFGDDDQEVKEEPVPEEAAKKIEEAVKKVEEVVKEAVEVK